jgi:uroporphyrinogen decarboxylase
MSGHALILALKRGRPNRTPTWLMRQAGRSLSAYRLMRERHSFSELISTPTLAAEVTAMPVERYGVDGAILFSDILVALVDLGIAVEFDPAPKISNIIQDPGAVKNLKSAETSRVRDSVRESAFLAKRLLAGSVPLIGFCGGPFTLAAYAVEGVSKSGFPAFKEFVERHPSAASDLIEKTCSAASALLSAQAEAGADALMVFDTWAAIFGCDAFKSHALPAAKRIVAAAKITGLPVIYMARQTGDILEPLRNVGADCYAVDWSADGLKARNVLPETAALMGNLDPAILLSSPEEIRQKADALASSGVFNVPSIGHGVLPETPEENIIEFVRAVHSAERGAR